MNNNSNDSIERGSGKFLSDKDIAQILSVTPSCIRKQRYLRKIGEDHFLKIEPVYIGRSPRYRSSEMNEWLGSL
jgi:hypothetical protein